jgi:hypothetical protein
VEQLVLAGKSKYGRSGVSFGVSTHREHCHPGARGADFGQCAPQRFGRERAEPGAVSLHKGKNNWPASKLGERNGAAELIRQSELRCRPGRQYIAGEPNFGAAAWNQGRSDSGKRDRRRDYYGEPKRSHLRTSMDAGLRCNPFL